jgi:pyruvate dehydrogenase E1 component
VLRAQELLATLGVSADVWSVTSYNELCREGLRVERQNHLEAGSPSAKPYVAELLTAEQGVFVAASDYMKSLPLGIASWVPGPYVVLGTDGYGLSESRADLRNWFEVSAAYIAWAALAALHDTGAVTATELKTAASTLGIDRHKPDPASAGPATVRH